MEDELSCFKLIYIINLFLFVIIYVIYFTQTTQTDPFLNKLLHYELLSDPISFLRNDKMERNLELKVASNGFVTFSRFLCLFLFL